jgi:hypothetical protein
MSNTSKVISPKRRRLTDLYLTGQVLELDDGTGDPIEIYMSKISPLEQRDAAENATKARAGVLLIKNSPDAAADRLIYEDQIYDLGLDTRQTWIEFLSAEKVQQTELSIEERLGSEGEWAENDYLKSLQEAWNDGLRDQWIADQSIDEDSDEKADEEADRVFNELKRFTDLVAVEMEEEIPDIQADYEHISDDELKRDVVNKIIESEADFAWLNEFAHWQVFYSVREPDDHKQRYFEAREEVDGLDNRILTELISKYREMTVDGVEGKD